MEHVISIGVDGRVRSMHNDKFNLGVLGPQRIERASDIRFNEDTQQWDIWFVIDGEYEPPAPPYRGFSGYDEARKFEVLVMNECLKTGLPPDDPAVDAWAELQRAKL